MYPIIEKSIKSTQNLITPALDKIGEPFKYKIIETGFHGTCEWKLDNTGRLYISPKNGVYGKLDDCIGFNPNTKWLPYAKNIYHVTIEKGVWANKSAAFLFSGLYNCRIIDAERLNVSETKTFTCMFDGCKNLKKVDLRGWKTGNATDMGGMFHGCSKLEWVLGDFKNFDTSKVKNMSGMFFDCHSLQILNLNNFNLENVSNMTNMFAYCINLKALFFENFTKNNMLSFSETKDMFKCCWRLKEPYVKPKEPFYRKLEWPEDLNWKSFKLFVKKRFDIPLFKKLRKLKKEPSTT